ncbi:MAG TPA: CocE/NonD family hydrolase [Candidatus Thermoplasmatota archaeon]|nr:CocE/NonD family hydrolase [Candidatus Thermoplasmatota archaeon]
MRGGFAALATLALLAGCITTPAGQLDPAARLLPGLDAEGFAPALFSGFEFLELDLAVEDGLRLHADVYLPVDPLAGAGADVPTTFPTVLVLSPYWGGGTGGRGEIGYMPYDFLVQRLLPRGYAVVFGDLAGNGGSSGCWDFMGPVERKSAVAMVEAIAAQDWSDGKIGMMGLSYDGMTQIMAASDAAPHLVTVVPAAPLTHAYAGLIQNGVHYAGGWHATVGFYESASLLGPGPTSTARHPGWIETVRDSPRCMADNHLGYTPLHAYNDYFQARDYRPLGANVKASVFYIQGWMDQAVKPDNFGEWFDAVPTMKKAWLGHWYHEYPTAENAGRDDMYLTLHRWFDFTLKGIPNGIDKEPVYDVQDSQGRWRRADAWPPADATPLTLQLGADGTLVQSGAKPGRLTFGGAENLQGFVLGDGRGTLAFETDALADGLHIVGRPVLNLTLSSDRPAGTIIARLWDGDRLVSQGAYNLLYAAGLESPQPLTPGAPVTLGFEMYPTDWALTPGSALKLTLETQDRRLWYDPDATGAALTLDASETALLTLTTVQVAPESIFLTSCGEQWKKVVDDCWLDLEDKGVES